MLSLLIFKCGFCYVRTYIFSDRYGISFQVSQFEKYKMDSSKFKSLLSLLIFVVTISILSSYRTTIHVMKKDPSIGVPAPRTARGLIKVPRSEKELFDLYRPIPPEEMILKQKKANKVVEPLIMSRSDLSSFADVNLVSLDSKDAKAIFSTPKEVELPIKTRSKRVIFFVTPTYKRDTQIVDLTKLSQTLQLAQLKYGIIIHWIIIEDSTSCTNRIRDLATMSGLSFSHLSITSPLGRDNPHTHKGVNQRNAALDLIEKMDVEGLIYLGDDDNTYDVTMLADMTRVKRFGLYPVAFAGGGLYERCKTESSDWNKVTKLASNFQNNRKYTVDMASIVFSTTLLKNTHVRFNKDWRHGHLESMFTDTLISSKDDIEPMGSSCNVVYVYHIKTHHANYRNDVLNDNSEQFKLMKNTI